MENTGEYREFRITATNPGLSYHLMRINSKQYDLQSIGNPVKFYRGQKTNQEISQEDAQGIDVGNGSSVKGRIPGSGSKFKSKSFFIGRDDVDAQGGLRRGKEADPDRNPFILANQQKSVVFEGNLEGGTQNSNYILLMFYNEGFQVIPCSKRYKFTKKGQYQKLTLEEAEQALSEKSKGLGSQNLWMMQKRNKGAEGEAFTRKFKVAENVEKSRKTQRFDEELDYEEEFQDDDGFMELGIEDEDEAKEARQRALGKAARKANMEDLDEDLFEERKGFQGKTGKDIKKSLKRLEKSNIYESDEENPYATDEDDDDDELFGETKEKNSEDSPAQNLAKKKQALKDDEFFKRLGSGQASPLYRPIKSSSPLAVLEALKNEGKFKKDANREGSSSPYYREKSMSPALGESKAASEDAIPKLKFKIKSDSSTASDLKRKRDEESALVADGKKVKPASPENRRIPTPGFSSATPPFGSQGTAADDVNLISEQEFIQVMKALGDTSVKDVVTKFKDRVAQDQRNKNILRKYFQKLTVSADKVLRLKDEYK